MTLRAAVRLLLMLVLGLPLVQAILMWVGGLLRAMGDETAAEVTGGVNTGVGVLWIVMLVGLVVALAFDSLDRPPRDT
jgi:hypothetical protein